MKTALVTGATGGLGLALTNYLVDKGWQVFAADCNEDALAELNARDNVLPIYLDVTSMDSIRQAFEKIKAQVEQLDAVVNFAGILRVGALVEFDEATMARILDINLMGTFRVNQVFFPMLKQGRIVNISSETGWHTAAPFNGPYAMSKYGIEAYTDALRRELSVFDIPVIKVQPGPFKTNMVSGVVQDFYRAADESTLYPKSLKKMGELTDEANRKAVEPKHLAEVIYKALTVKKPKAAYSVKADPARSFMELWPLSWADFVYKKLLTVK